MLYPIIHGIASHEPGRVDLTQDRLLQLRVDVGQKNNAAFFVFFRKAGFKKLENIKLGLQRFGAVQIIIVKPAPPEGLALLELDAVGINAEALDQPEMLLRKIFTYNRDKRDRTKKPRAGAEKSG